MLPIYTGKDPAVQSDGMLGRRQAPMTDRGLSMSAVDERTVELGGQAFVAAQIRENDCRRGVSAEWQPPAAAINVAAAFNRAKILIQTTRFR